MATQDPLITSIQNQRNTALDTVAELNAQLIRAAEIIGKQEKEIAELNDKIKQGPKPPPRPKKAANLAGNSNGVNQQPN